MIDGYDTHTMSNRLAAIVLEIEACQTSEGSTMTIAQRKRLERAIKSLQSAKSAIDDFNSAAVNA